MALWPDAVHHLLIVEVSRSYTTTFGRIPLDEWSARRRDLYLTKRNPHNRPISMSPAGFEPSIAAGQRPQTYALDRPANGTGHRSVYSLRFQPHTKYLIVNKKMASSCGDTDDNSIQCRVSCICIWHLIVVVSVRITDKCTVKTRAGRTFIFVLDCMIRDTKVELADDV